MKYPIGTKVYYFNDENVKEYGVVVSDLYPIKMVEYYTWVKWDKSEETLWIRDEDLYSDAPNTDQTIVQWEYKLISTKLNAIFDGTTEEFLNQYGAEGWELTCIDYGSFIFKRKKI